MLTTVILVRILKSSPWDTALLTWELPVSVWLKLEIVCNYMMSAGLMSAQG